MMPLFEKVSIAIKEAKEKKQQEQEKKALALKELRSKSIPVIQSLVEKYEANITWLDTDAYVYVVENEKERGIYIPYGTPETTIDIKLDNLINNFKSATKHKLRSVLEKGADIATRIEEGYQNQDRDIQALEPKTKIHGFWNNPPSLSDLDTSLNKRRK